MNVLCTGELLTSRYSCTRLIGIAATALGLFAACANAHAAPFVLAYADSQTDQSYTNLQAFFANLSAVGLGSAYAMQSSGEVDTSGVTPTTLNLIKFAKAKGLPLYPTVSDYSNAILGFDPAVSSAVVHAKSVAAIDNLVSLAKNNGFAGIDLDFEAVQNGDKAAFSTFVSSLASKLHQGGMKLIVSIPPKTGDTSPDYENGYDYSAIGSAVDYFQVMTYDEVGPGWCSTGYNGNVWPGPVTGLDWMTDILNYTVSRVPPAKVLSGLATYGQDYSTGNTVNWSAYAATIAAHSATVQRDAASSTPYATWGVVKPVPDGTAFSKSTAQPVLWYDDAESIRTKTALAGRLGLAGTSVWAMGYEDASFWSAVQAGLQGNASAAVVLHATSGAGGSIAPAGNVSVQQGANASFAFTPKAGFTLDTVAVDGKAVPNASSYVFYDVQSSHSISVSFSPTPSTADHTIGTSGTGYVWAKNTSASSNANRSANRFVNDGNLTQAVVLNPQGEGGKAKWEAAGMTWSSAKSIASVAFVQSATDGNGNGYLTSALSLQFSTDGSTWYDSGWRVSPAYPYGPASTAVTYTFSGAAAGGIVGVRVTGKTGADSWSESVNEVNVLGH